MNIRSGFMRLNARKCTLYCKSRSYFNGRFFSSAPRAISHENTGHLIDRYQPNSLLSIGIASDRRCMKIESRSNTSLRSYPLRFYSSKADEKNAENKDEETRGARFRDEFLSEIVTWEKTPVSFGNFPYYMEWHEVPCGMRASHLKQNKFRKYGGIWKCSDNIIQLRSIPGNQRYKSSLVGIPKTPDKIKGTPKTPDRIKGTPKTAGATTYPKEFCEWLAGIIDGDGSIQVSKKGCTSLEITMGFEDLKLLRYIQNALGGGIKMRAGAKSFRYRLHHHLSMIKVMNCINGHIRHSARLVQLHRVCQVLEIPVILPFPLDAQSNWFAGFFDANGTITISMENRLPQLSVRVTNKLLQDVEPCKIAFGGSLYFDSGRNGYYTKSKRYYGDARLL
ncbi:hypothetical protein OROHE_004309 [Orobanche hederae]